MVKALNYSHHQRLTAYVEAKKLTCMDCHGRGGETIPVLDYGQGPFEECGWCEGTGYMTPFHRGLWLRLKKADKWSKPGSAKKLIR